MTLGDFPLPPALPDGGDYPVDPRRHFCDVGGVPRPGSALLRKCRCGRLLWWTGRRWKHPGKIRLWLMRTWISEDYGMRDLT